jgi:hypothetical protein
MSADLSGEITAIATAVLAVGAIVTAVFAYLAYRKQSQEVDTLVQQNEREADGRRRSQAALVFLGVPPGEAHPVRPYAQNASGLPVYDAQLWYFVGSINLAGPDNLGLILPGQTVAGSRDFAASDALTKTWLTFQDAASALWIREPTGVLKEDDRATHSHMIATSLPADWTES